MSPGMGNDHSESILSIVAREEPRLRAISGTEAGRRPAPSKWSRKEVLGHLVDSVANNQQRVVRALLSEALDFPGYTQNEWVDCQGYADADWGELIDLWVALNRHFARTAARIPDARRATPCRIGTNAAMTLEELVADYVRHLAHHLPQI